MILLGYKKLCVNGKTFTMNDSEGTVYPRQLEMPDDFCGGSVTEFRKTKYGIYLCLNKRSEILFLGYTENSLTDAGKELLGMKNPPEEMELSKELLKEPEFKYDSEKDEALKHEVELSRKGLIALAKEKGISGKIATMKTEELRKLVAEAV